MYVVFIAYSGTHEQCEFVVDDVLVEVSGHHGIGRIYLTDFRLVIVCARVSSTSLAKMSDLSMWVALNLIQSVERGDEQKVISKKEVGTSVFICENSGEFKYPMHVREHFVDVL